MVKNINEVVSYVETRLVFNDIDYHKKTASTGTVYIILARDKLRIGDHAGTTDDYNYIIRCDCKAPASVKGVTVVPAYMADFVLDEIIKRNKSKDTWITELNKSILSKSWTKHQVKRLDVKTLYQIVKWDKTIYKPFSKEMCLGIIVENPELFENYLEETNNG